MIRLRAAASVFSGLMASAALLWLASAAAHAQTIPSSAIRANGTSVPVNAQAVVDASGAQTCVAANPCAAAITGSASANGSSTITTGGVAQALFSGAAPVHGWKVQNLGASNCYVSDETTTPSASTAGSYTVFANGGQYSTEPGQLPVGPVYLTCPTTGQAFSAQKW